MVKKTDSKKPRAKKVKVVETPVVETPVVETPVVETPVVETPVVETPVVETPVVETPITPATPSKRGVRLTPEELQAKFDTLIASLQEEQAKFKETKNVDRRHFTKLIKEVKDLKNETRKTTKTKSTRRVTNGNGGFSKPVAISDELCAFGGWTKGELKSRTDVTRFLCSYIKEHNLQNPENKSVIVPDKKLQKLLDPKKSLKEPLKYTLMMRLIQPHFVKA